MRSLRYLGPSLILAATLAASVVLGPEVVRRTAWSRTASQLTTVRDGLAADPNLALLSNAFQRVAQAVEPSVVHIRVYRRGGGAVVNRYDPPSPSGNGSGWVYRHDAGDGAPRDYILTNHHVVDNAGRIVVRFADGREYDARLLGSDEATDVAVLDVDGGPFHAAAISPEPVMKGQLVFAFGSPLDFDFSVSQGIVSASGRQLSLDLGGKYESYIQTDAAINPGNSGGPLTDIYGRVVGMNFAIAAGPSAPADNGVAGSRGFLGLGFAIPAPITMQVADQLIEAGTVARGYLAVIISEVSSELAMALGLPEGTRGVLMSHPIAGGPGARAGLQPGDVAVAVAGQRVETPDQLRYLVSTFAPGSEIDLQVLRAGEPEEVTVRVTLGILPEPTQPTRRIPRPDFIPSRGYTHDVLQKFGIERLADFTSDNAAKLNLPENPDVEGPMAIDVRYGSYAHGQRVRRQSIITHVDRQRVRNEDDLRAALAAHDPQHPLLLTLRYWDSNEFEEHLTRFVLLTLP